MKTTIYRVGANYLAVGDIVGNVIVIKPTPREFFFKFCDRVLEGSSRFHHILSINFSPNSSHLLISRGDGKLLVFEEFKEAVSIIDELEIMEQVSRAKANPKKASKSIPKTPIDAGGRVAGNAADDGDPHENGDALQEKAQYVEQTKLFQFYSELNIRPLGANPIQCCSISDFGM
jgi:hypothetical protein